jgi:autotransporter-associated beta strand protein
MVAMAHLRKLAPRPWRLEWLEERTTPALQLTLAAGVLTLQENGTTTDNVTLNSPTSQQLQIATTAPFDAGSSTGVGLTYNTGNPATATVVDIDLTTVTSLVVNLGGSNDTLTVNLNDNFVLTGSKTVNIDLGAGNDQLILVTLTNQVSNYTLTTGNDDDTLQVAGTISAFVGTLKLGAGNDRASFSDAQLASQIDGEAGTDVYDLSAWTGSVAVNLASETATTGTFFRFEEFIGGANSDNGITLGFGANSVQITGTNLGTVNGATKFSKFSRLTGSSGNDTFAFDAGASLTGPLDGALGTNTIDYNTLDFAQAVTITLASPNAGTASAVGGGFDDISAVIGDQSFVATNQLIGTVNGQLYQIQITDSGTVGTFDFFNFGSLVGGVGNDQFIFSPGATLSGTLNGAGGNNKFDLTALTTPQTVNYVTGKATPVLGGISNLGDVFLGAGNDLVTLPTPTFSYTADGGAGGNTLDFQGTGTQTPTSLTGGTITNSGNVLTYENFSTVIVPTPTINGTAGNDRIYIRTVSGTSILVSVNNDAPQAVDLTTANALIVNGLAGTDALVVDFSLFVPAVPFGLTLDSGGDVGDRIVLGGDGKLTGVFRPNSSVANVAAFFVEQTAIGMQNLGAMRVDLRDWGSLTVESTSKTANFTLAPGGTYDSENPPPAITGQPLAGPETANTVRITGDQGGLPIGVAIYRVDELSLDTGRIKTSSVDVVSLSGDLTPLVGKLAIFTGLELDDQIQVTGNTVAPAPVTLTTAQTNFSASAVTAPTLTLNTNFTFAAPLTLNGGVLFNGTGTGAGQLLVVNGPLAVATDVLLTVGQLTAQSTITGSFGLTVTGAATLNDTVSLSQLAIEGPVTLTNAVVIGANGGISLPAGVSGAFELTLNSLAITTVGPIDVRRLTTDSAGNTFVSTSLIVDDADLGDPVSLGGPLTVTTTGTARFRAGISGSAGITSTGSGTLRLDGLNSYNGATTINAGTLLVNGDLSASSSLTVAAGATLGGGQTGFGQLPAVLTLIGSTLAPGDATGPGWLKTAAPTVDLGSVFQVGFKAVTFAGNTVSQLDLTNPAGTLDLTGTALDAVFFPDFVPIEGQVYPIITRAAGAPAVTGTFSNTPGNSITLGGVRFTVNYAATDGVTLTVVDAAPLIVSGPPTAATVGAQYSFQVLFTGLPAPALNITGLPPGLGFDATSGLISGVPTQVGSFTLTITADNGTGMPAVQTTSLVVNPPSNQPPIANPDTFVVVAGQTLTVAAPGVLSNDTDVEGAALSAILVTPPTTGTLVLNANGSFTYTAPAAFSGAVTFTYAASDGAIESASTTVTLNVTATNVSSTPGERLLAVTGSGQQAFLYTFGPNGKAVIQQSFTPFTNAGGFLRAATGDFNGDGVADVAYVTGPGGGAFIRIVSGVGNVDLLTGKAVDLFPGQNLTNIGLFVAAGDIDGDGKDEIAISPDQGGGPLARIFSISSGNLVQRKNFLAIQDPNFRGGARVALGDLNGDGKADLIVGAGFQGGPRIALYDGANLLTGAESLPPDQTPPKFVGDFFVFEPDPATGVPLLNGVFVTAGDLDGDGKAELIFGGGPGGGPRVQVLRFADIVTNLDAAKANSFSNFFAFDSSQRGGVRPIVKDIDGDDRLDLIAGNGEGGPSLIKSFRGSTFAGNGSPGTEVQTLDVFQSASLAAGIYVG